MNGERRNLHGSLTDAGASMFQLGYVFPNISMALNYYERVLATGEFLRLNDAKLYDVRYNGVDSVCQQNIAFGFLGDLNIELIEPIVGASSYSAFLDERPLGGLHHVGFKVHNFDGMAEYLAGEGFRVVHSGRFGAGTRFAYADTCTLLGHFTEIVYFDEPTAQLFEELRLKGKSFPAAGVQGAAGRIGI